MGSKSWQSWSNNRCQQPQSHQQPITDHSGLHGVALANLARIQVHYRCGIEPALFRSDVSDVREPLLVGCDASKSRCSDLARCGSPACRRCHLPAFRACA